MVAVVVITIQNAIADRDDPKHARFLLWDRTVCAVALAVIIDVMLRKKRSLRAQLIVTLVAEVAWDVCNCEGSDGELYYLQ